MNTIHQNWVSPRQQRRRHIARLTLQEWMRRLLLGLAKFGQRVAKRVAGKLLEIIREYGPVVLTTFGIFIAWLFKQTVIKRWKALISSFLLGILGIAVSLRTGLGFSGPQKFFLILGSLAVFAAATTGLVNNARQDRRRRGGSALVGLIGLIALYTAFS